MAVRTARVKWQQYSLSTSLLYAQSAYRKKGRGRALKQVWLQSRADIVSYMDIDLSTNLGAFVPMITPLVTGDAAIAVGSRLMKES